MSTTDTREAEQEARLQKLEKAVFGATQATPPTTPTTTPPTSPLSGLDKFGLKMLYATKTNGETWFFNPDTFVSLKDPRVITSISTSELHKNSDGSIKVTKSSDAQNRFYITTSAGYEHSKCSQSWSTNLQRGYMQSIQDWRNVEITSLVRLNSVWQTSGHSLVWYARGGRHSNSYSCEGSGYKANIGYNLQSRFQKESGHPNYDTTSWKSLPSSSTLAYGKWFGYKGIIYDIGNNVKVEIWIDAKLDGNWQKVNEKLDDGISWGSQNTCGDTNQKFLWGGPLVTYRFDAVKDIDFNFMSVREINPPQ